MKEIKLSQGKTSLVDDEDFEKFNIFNWNAHKKGNSYYAKRGVRIKLKHKTLLLHREILDAPDGFDVDHIDGNGLNNQKSNLRICTRKQNLWNSSPHKDNANGAKGVSWHKQDKKWRVRIMKDGINYELGLFDSIKEAKNAYNIAAKKYHGSFSRLNTL